MMLKLSGGFGAAVLLSCAACCPASALDGFTLVGNNWAYVTPGRTNTGILLKPSGPGPFAAILISHGKGGTVSGFTLPKAQVMTNWGFVCIGPEYTHAAGSTVTNLDGASAENIARARECLTILQSLAYVDTNRIAAYGNSMGAFVTVALAAAETQRVASAAITAGGCITQTGYAAPSTGIAAQVVAPFLMLHGAEDTTVDPGASLLLQQVLDARSVTNRRILFEGIDHGLHNNTNTAQTCNNLLREWFLRQGPLPTTGNAPPSVSAVAAFSISGDAPSAPRPLGIGDAETGAATLTLAAFSSVPGVIPPGGVSFGGGGSNRTFSLTPAGGATGTVTLAITVSDGVLPATAVFNVSVTHAATNSVSTNTAVGPSAYDDQPRGIYVLDGPNSTTNLNGVAMRDGNIRTNDFVAGYALRVAWTNLEPAMGQFDFTILDWNVRRLTNVGKKLSLLFMNTDPAWIAATTGVVTWFDSSLSPARPRAVPWDPFLLDRMDAVVRAVADHEVDGVKLRDHPALSVVNFGLAGAFLAIRDPAAVAMRNMTNYSRANLTNAVLRNLRAATSNFPGAFVQIGFWPVTDAQASPSLWETMRQAVLAEFDGSARPKVGFWMENLSASRTAPGQDPVSGKPNTNFAAPLYLSRTNTWANFQALTSWTQPFNNHGDSVTNATAGDGMAYANSVFGSTYFELYVSDIDSTTNREEMLRWNAFLFPPQQIALAATGGVVSVQWPSWPGGQYRVERSQDLASWTGAPPVLATNSLTSWPDAAATGRFYRVRVFP